MSGFPCDVGGPAGQDLEFDLDSSGGGTRSFEFKSGDESGLNSQGNVDETTSSTVQSGCVDGQCRTATPKSGKTWGDVESCEDLDFATASC